ncbi:MAG TPA: sensor histidine kinase [Chloroflexota bacterium]|nr:sensor histidine kinase [Chloroflexota bacterium]
MILNGAIGRIGGLLVRHALATTANYLEDNSLQVVDTWIERLRGSMPSYAPLIPEMRQRGESNLNLLVQLLRLEEQTERDATMSELLRIGREMASLHLARGIPLYEIVRATSLFRLSVLNAVERMLRSRVWIAFPHDILKAEDIINVALDNQMLVTSESYLEERDKTIQQSQSELEATNSQLKVLVQEMHHRIKNNLQTIADLLTLEIHSGRKIPTEVALRESISRVRSIAVVHELLSADDVEVADIKELADVISENCARGMAAAHGGVQVVVQGESILLPSKQATALALVMTELVNNALEHAFGPEGGTLLVSLDDQADEVRVSVRDNGKGLPDGFNVETSPNLGLQIVRTLVTKDLSGTLELKSNGGTTATVRFRR